MLKQSAIIIILGLSVLACTGNQRIKKPSNLIPAEKMSDILYDLYTINAAKGVNRKMLEKNGFVPETYVLTKYNIDSIQFAESNNYYAYDNEEYKTIVEKVKARLEKEKEAYEKIMDKEEESKKSRIDSIKQLGEKKKDSIKKVVDNVGFKIDSVTTN